MSKPPYRPRELRWQMFRGSAVLDQQVLTPGQLRSSAWQRLLRDVYADSRLDRDHGLKCRAASFVIPDRAALSGVSAAWLHGVEFAAGWSDPVHVTAPEPIRFGPVGGLTVHAAALPDCDVVTRQGLPCTAAGRAAWDIARWLDTPRAVSILDGMLRGGIVLPAELPEVRARYWGERGFRRAERAFGLVDGRAQSVPESTVRVRLVLAGLPRPTAQLAIQTRGGVILHPDLAWEEYQVALEYDGAYHSGPANLELDRKRLNLLLGEGWLVLHATRAHLGRDFGQLARQVTDALSSRGWRPGTAPQEPDAVATSGKLSLPGYR